jgi:hypothetical protein
MKNATLIVFLALLFAACDNGKPTIEAEEPMAKPEITLNPKKSGQEFPGADMEDWKFENGKFTFTVDPSTYEFGVQTPDAISTMCANSGKGQHIHLIVDNQPYAAKYTPEFDYEIEDGEHSVLAFLSRSYHESIKTPAAHKAVVATVENNTFTKVEPVTGPMLYYSRPKGTYVGKDAKALLLDFYVENVTLDANHQVKVETNGKTFMVDKWQPYILEGLPMGENEVTLTLVDGSGKKIDAPLNPVTRKFTLKADPMDMKK